VLKKEPWLGGNRGLHSLNGRVKPLKEGGQREGKTEPIGANRKKKGKD